MVSPAWTGVSSVIIPLTSLADILPTVLLVLRRHGPPPLRLRVSTNMA